jgi:acyl-CoA reductase-like NAD-dependent aldehyde dehydrogenase
VLDDANLERAANGIVWAAFTNAGQNCGAVERVYVADKIAKEFQAKVVAAVAALTGADVGPLTTLAQAKIVAKHVDAAKEAGAEVLSGGTLEGQRYAPTVLLVTDEDTPLMQDESFGPLLPLVVVKSEEDAIERANASRYGLSASVWTKNYKRAENVAKQLRAGVVTINNHSFTGALPMAPWTGVGETGWGVTNSHHALDILTRPRFILTDRNKAKRELWWYPYTPTLKAIAYALAKMNGGASLFGRIGAVFTLLKNLPKRLGGG